MNARVIGKQRGQAMSEFVVAMIAFVPLVLGVIYIGKYSDIKHQAIQASRYAAFERALDPHSHEGGTTVQDETVARFFRDGGQHTIGFQDKATGSTRTDENPVWAQVNGNPMIGQYPDVSVQFSSKSVKDSTTSTLLFPMDLMTKSFSGLNDDGSAVEADVSVKVADIAHFAPLSNINLSVGATTVIAGDPWNAGGAQDVANHFPSSLQLPPPAKQLPAPAVRAATGVLETLARAKRAKTAPLLNKSRLRFLYYNQRYSIEKARSELGYEPQFSFRTGLPLALDALERCRVGSLSG